jgi:hypothetical protein
LSAKSDQIDLKSLNGGGDSWVSLPVSTAGWTQFSLQLDDSGDELIISSETGVAYAMNTNAVPGTQLRPG